MLQVRGRPEPFRHLDRNTLAKVGEAQANPLARIARGEATKMEAHGFS